MCVLTLQELVQSFDRLCTPDGATPELNVTDLVRDPSVLQDAIEVAKDNVIEWMQAQDQLLAKQAEEQQFVFRVKKP